MGLPKKARLIKDQNKGFCDIFGHTYFLLVVFLIKFKLVENWAVVSALNTNSVPLIGSGYAEPLTTRNKTKP